MAINCKIIKALHHSSYEECRVWLESEEQLPGPAASKHSLMGCEADKYEETFLKVGRQLKKSIEAEKDKRSFEF